MTLIVDKIKVVEESDEAWSDDVYLVVFRGRTVAPFESNVQSIGPGVWWDDSDTGDTHHSDVNLAFTQSDAVYGIQLVEMDDGRDVNGDAVLGAYKTQAALAWRAAMLSLLAANINPSSEQGRAAGFEAIRQVLLELESIYMEFPKGNDDSLGIKRVAITQSGQKQTVRFRSNAEDATYDVFFKHS